MTRLHQILIGLLAAQLILVGLVFFLPKPGQAAATPLLGATQGRGDHLVWRSATTRGRASSW